MKMVTRSAGTLAFVAPERLKEGMQYTEKVDMWAAGIVLYMLLVGEFPFSLNGSTMELFE
jgi:serine/threonine protein kinase